MRKRIGQIVLIGIIISNCLTLCLAGMESQNYRISRSVLSGGGAFMGSENYMAEATLGQASPTGPSSSENSSVQAGFWFSIVAPVIAEIEDYQATYGVAWTGPTPVLTQGSQVTWYLDAGPPGMTINSSTGVVSWPSPSPIGGTFTVTIRATNFVGSDDEGWQLTVVPGAPAITTTSPLTSGKVGSAYSQLLEASDGVTPYTWSATSISLPPGLSLSSGGLLSGTPTTANTYSFTARVTGANSLYSEKNFSLTVNQADCTISGYVRTSSGTGISDVTVTFSNSGGTATTDSSGSYSGTVPYGWSGTARPGRPGYRFSPTYLSFTNVTSNQSSKNFTGTPPTNPRISGYVRTSSGSGISDVTVTFSNSGGTATTNSSGFYTRTVSYGWSGSATPSRLGYMFSPTSLSYTNIIANQWSKNYTGTWLSDSVAVTLGPAGVVSEGAQWNVDGGAWQNSGAAVSGLSPGVHTINYKKVTGWLAPSSETLTITSEQNIAITRDYKRQTMIFYEDWESGTIDGAKWVKFGNPLPVLASPGQASSYALDVNSDDWWFSGVYSDQSFILSNGFTLEFWLKGHSSSVTTHQRIVAGISDNVVHPEGHTNTVVSVQLDCPSMPTPRYLYSLDGLESFQEPYVDDNWHKISVTVNLDGRVSFYRDDVHKFTTTSAIEFSQFNSQKIQFFGNYSSMYVDDISVETLENYTDELVANLGGEGLWHYDELRGWTKWNTVNPSQMVTVDLNGDGTDELVASLPGEGLNTYDSVNGWQQFNDVIPENMIRFTNGIVCDYGAANGLLLWDQAGGWQQINTGDADKMIAADIDGDGEDELIASFIGYGSYIFDDLGGWTQINTAIPEAMVRFSNGVVCDYGASFGLWSYNKLAGWVQLNTSDPDKIVAVDIDDDTQDELVVSLTGSGLQIFEPVEGVWQQIHTVIPDALIGLNNAIAADYGAINGLWVWSQGGGWQQRSTEDPEQMLAVDIDNDGVEELVVSFSGYGLYYHDETNGWQFLNAVIPEDMKPINFYP